MTHTITFQKSGPFTRILRSRVDAYFSQESLDTTATPSLHVKILIGFALLIMSYIFLLLYVTSITEALFATFFLAQGSIILWFNGMHDGAHGAYSRKGWINFLLSAISDLLWGSQFLWKQQHNLNHHTYTNIHGKDTDIESSGILRFSPEQPWKWWHRYQYIFGPISYAFLTLMWFFTDFSRMFEGEINGNKFPKRKIRTWSYFFITKMAYLIVAIIIPLYFYDIGVVLGFFVLYHLIFGFTMTMVFSLAHVSDTLEFPASDEKWVMPYEYIEHELRTTRDFAPSSSLATWYMWGLNYQVVHHLFPHVSHVHYPALQKIIESTCREYDMPYHCSPSVWSAIQGHYRQLWNMSKNQKIL